MSEDLAETLTEAKVRRFVRTGLAEGKTESTLWADAPKGFGLRLRKGGSTAWLFVFRPKGAGRREASRKVTLGGWPTLTLRQAEAAAQALAGKVALGADPAADLRVERTRERRILSAALDEYERALRRRKIVNTTTIVSTLKRGLAPHMAQEIDALKRKDLIDRIDTWEAAGKPGAAADLRKHSRSLLEWAVTKGLVPFNVLAGLRRPRQSRAERLQDESKGRALSDNELRTVWVSAAAFGPFGGLLRLGLLTGMRRGELAALKWSDVKDDRIVIEAHGSKTGVQHEVPLTTAMRAVLGAQAEGTSGLAFPSRAGGKIAGWSKLVPKAARESGVAFRLHDLRRSARTIMSKTGVAEDVAELAIGHVRRGLVATYNKDAAWSARVDAFERVSAHIAKVLAGGGAGDGITALSAYVRSSTTNSL